MRKLYNLIFIILLFCGCGSQDGQRMLDRAGTVINDDPDSALAILDCMDENHLSRSQRMKRLLLLTNAQNKCDTIFRSDSIQRILVDYYEHHGSANDRMLAHYLLGRAYYDMGEMPMALNAYQLALADTTETEHDYYQLTRITAQMSKIYYHHQKSLTLFYRHQDFVSLFRILLSLCNGVLIMPSSVMIAFLIHVP